MDNFHLGKNDDSRGFVICLVIFSFILLIKEIFNSGYIIYAVSFIVLSVIVWFAFNFIVKKLKNRPVWLGSKYKKKYPIIIQYMPPKGINAAEAGLLYNLKVEPTDLTSLIYQWKFEGLIDITTFKGKNSNKEYVKLTKKDDLPLTSPLFETAIFDSIFAMGDVKIIEESFQLKYALLLDDLEEHGIMKGWIVRPPFPKILEAVYNILAILLFIFVFLILTDVFVFFSAFCWISFSILLFVFIIMGGYLYGGGRLKLTDKGAELASHLIGYRNFIKSCDEKKIELLLKDDPLFIDRTLPYATAFGIETEFLKKISPLRSDWNARYVRGTKIPTWTRVLRALIGSGNDFRFS